MAKYVFNTNSRQESALQSKIKEINIAIEQQGPDREKITAAKFVSNALSSMLDTFADAPLIKEFEKKKLIYARSSNAKRKRIDAELDS